MRFFLIDDVYLVTDRLVVDQGAILDQIPLLGFDTFIVITNIAERVFLGLVRKQVDDIGAVIEGSAPPFIQCRKTVPA